MSEYLEIPNNPSSAGYKTLKDFDTGPKRSRYEVREGSDGYKQYLLDLAEELQNNIQIHKKRYPDLGHVDNGYARHQRSLWETKLEEINTALVRMSGDIIDRLGKENDHLLWLEAVTVYSEKIDFYQNALNSPSSILSEDEKDRYRTAIGELSQRIERLELLLDAYANKLRQGLGESAFIKATTSEPTPEMASV